MCVRGPVGLEAFVYIRAGPFKRDSTRELGGGEKRNRWTGVGRGEASKQRSLIETASNLASGLNFSRGPRPLFQLPLGIIVVA